MSNKLLVIAGGIVAAVLVIWFLRRGAAPGEDAPTAGRAAGAASAPDGARRGRRGHR